MNLMSKPCKLPKPVSPRSVKKELTADKTKKMLNSFFEKLTMLNPSATSNQVAANTLSEKLDTVLHGLVDATITRGTKYQYLQAWLSQTLGWRKGLMENEFTTTGAVQERWLRMTEAVGNVLESHIQATVIPEIRVAVETIKGYGIESLKEAQVILHDAAIVSSSNRIIAQNSNSELVARFLEQRDLLFRTRLAEDYGLDSSQIDNIIQLGTNYEKVYADAFDYIRNAGIPVKKLEGYVPVTFDTDFTKYIEEKFNNLDALLGDLGTSSTTPLKGRAEYVDYIVSDVATATHMLGGLKSTLGREVYPTDILRWSTEPGTFKAQVLNKISASAVESLLDSGAIAKIPSMYADLVEWYVYRQGVPAGIAQDILISDPVKAITEYTVKLRTNLKESSLLKDLLTNGLDKGWLATKEQLGDNVKNIESDFLQLSDPKLAGLIDTYVNAPGVAAAAKNLYVHKSVAQAMQALVDFNTSPDLLGVTGQMVHYFGKFNSYLSKSMLANPVTAVAQITQNAMQMYSAVGSIHRYPQALVEVLDTMVRGVKSLDNTRVVIDLGGEELTKQGLIERLMMTRASNPFNQLGSGDAVLNPGNAIAALRQSDVNAIIRKAQWNMKHMPVNEKVLKVMGLPGDVINQAFKPIALSNYLVDLSGRYATIMSLADAGYRQGGKEFKTVEELIQYADEYFGIFDGSSSAAGTAGKYIMPFFSYTMNYPGQVVRHMMRHPRRFHNVYRLYHAYKQQGDRDDLSYYDKVSWQKEKLLIEVATDPVSGRKVMVSPSAVNAEMSFIEMVENGFKVTTRLFGLGSTNDRVADLEAKVNPAKTFGDAMANMVEGTYLSNIYETLTNKNPFSGEAMGIEEQYKTASILGVPVNPLTRRVMILAAPSLNTLDRMLPQEIVGRRATKNAAGVTLEPGVPSWLGVTPEQGGTQGQTEINATLGSLGLRATQVDTVRNLVTNYNELSTIIADSNRVVKSLTQQGKFDSEEVRNALQVGAIASVYKLEIDKRASQLGVPAPEVFNGAARLRVKPINDLLSPLLPKAR